MEEKNIKTYVVIKHRYKPKSKISDLHSHEFYQLIYVASGQGSIVIEDVDVDVDTGDIVFIAPNIQHAVNLTQSDMTTYEIKFNILDNELDEIAASIGILHYEDDEEKIKTLMLKIIDEAQRCEPYYQKSIENFISQIIIYLTRTKSIMEKNDDGSHPSYEAHSTIALRAKMHFDHNYSKRISLVDLARELCVSHSHMCREFTKKFGMAPVKYLNNLRMEKAKELLSVSDFSVTEIAEMVGFGDIHYFSRYFNRQENKSPVMYRNEVRENFVINMEE